MRDDFSQKVIEICRKRAAFVCSNPSCRASTIAGSTSDINKTVCTGIVCHITAASPNGPRYKDRLMQISAIENAIYLCANCSIMVDKNEGADFTENTLLQWKQIHENWVQSNLNKKWKEDEKASVSTTNQLGGIAANTVNILSSIGDHDSLSKDRELFKYSEKLLSREFIIDYNSAIEKNRLYKAHQEVIQTFINGFDIPEFEFIDQDIESKKKDLIDHFIYRSPLNKNDFLIITDCDDYFRLSFRDKRLPKVERKGFEKLIHNILWALGVRFDPDRDVPPWPFTDHEDVEHYKIDIDKYNDYRRVVKQKLFI